MTTTYSLSAETAVETSVRTITELNAATIRGYLQGSVGETTLPEPTWGPIGREVFERTYSRILPDGSQETWAQTCRRVVNGSLSFLPKNLWLPGEDVELFRLVYSFSAIPAGRHLWVTGTPLGHMSHNCFVAGHGRRPSDHFRYLASRLFEGGGVGSNYSADLLAQQPTVVGAIELLVTCRSDHTDIDQVREAAGAVFVEDADASLRVADTREGWVDAWSQVIDLAHTRGDHRVAVDVSDLRPFGAPLRTFGGRASGPGPFVTATRAIVGVLNSAFATGAVHERYRRLSGLEIMQIDHHIAASIVSGGARRSARMAMMHWRDKDVFDFIHCKADQFCHWSTNISVEIDDEFAAAVASGDPHALRVLRDVARGMALNGEPGIANTSLFSADEQAPVRVVNPCGEVGLQSDPLDGAGESCNLGSVDLSHFGRDDAGAERAFELMARFLYRSTLNPHHDEPARRIEASNRRLGVGLMGLQGWCAAHGVRLSELTHTPELQCKLASFRRATRRASDDLARKLGAPRSVKVTAIAPTGTIAQLSGTTPGIHPVMARYFIRRVRYSDSDPQLEMCRAAGLTVVPDIYAANTSVVEFVVKDQILDRYPDHLIEQADELSAEQFFDLLAVVQRSFCAPGDGNAISATAQITPDTHPAQLEAVIRRNLRRLKGMTVFPKVSRDLAPYEPLTEEEYLTRSQVGFATVGDSNDGECAGGACPVR